MLEHIFRAYGLIGEINLEENIVNIVGAYNPSELLIRLIGQLEKGREFARSIG